ncbi:uncharacterized protein LOC123515025 isoform X3 [Portunus trituberculatus]|uniref:uncharacterized protein LOC123515025 isoform X3 n=1 Tax=Portunus trituberculatus TaxID=210409 RepID=UPI001E1CFF12|nr:uncharacterized protein LOC123515025 isoform X3 [Portunus trituberculatus]
MHLAQYVMGLPTCDRLLPRKMPFHKGVETLSTLCVQRIGQLFIEITKCLNRCSTSKKKGILAGQKLANKKNLDKNNEKKSDEKDVQSQNVTKEGEEKEETLKPELSETNGHAVPQAEQVLEALLTPPSQNEEEKRKKHEELELLCQDIGQALTSHSHVTLHRSLFTSISLCLDPVYMKEKWCRHTIQSVLVLFLNASLRELDFGERKMFSEYEMCQVLVDQLHHAVKLEKLIIGRPCYWRSQIFENLNVKLMQLPHLVVLKIQFICTPEMINGLSQNCPNLRELSVRGSEKLSDEDCDEIAKCEGLDCLDISGTRITGKGCWKILDSVKNLSWLHHCAFNCNSDSLLFESRTELFNYVKEQLSTADGEQLLQVSQPEMTLRDVNFNLKNFWLFNPITYDLITTCLCPDLEHLRLDFIFQDLLEEPEVSILSSLTKLKKLEVNFYDQCFYNLGKAMLEACGEYLTCLSLHLADDWFVVAPIHNVVASCCPNLVTLLFSGDYKARHTLEECDEQLDFQIPGPAHPHLLHLRVTGVVSDQRLRFLLSHAPALQTIHLDGELEWLYDATLATALQINPLPDLEEIWFNVSTTVTLATVRLLLQQDNPLKCIGRLCHMGEATMGEYQELLAQVRQHNLNIKLIWVTDERIRK